MGNERKRCERLGLILVAWVTMLSCGAAFGEALFNAGKTEWKIVIPEKPDVAVEAAAAEFQRAVERISGARLEITRASVDGAAEVKDAVVIAPTLAAGPDDLIEIHERPQSIRLLANGSRATQYAVSRFLQDRLGCRWYWPGEITASGESEGGEYLPPRKAYQPKSYDRSYKPVFRYRELSQCSWHGHTPTELWMIRNCLNCGRQGGGVAAERFVRLASAGHAIGVNEKEFDAHPDWFCQVGGKRVKDGISGCWSNPGFTAKMSDFCLKLAEKADILVTFPRDVCQRCECADCTRNPDRSARWYAFYDKITAAARAKHPQLQVGGIAYQEYAHVPSMPVDWLAYNEYCQYDRCYIHRLGDPDCAVNAKSMRVLKEWQAKCRMAIYGYHFDVFNDSPLVPFWNMLADEMRTYSKMDIVRVKTEMPIGRRAKQRPEDMSHVANRICYWMYAQLAWDPRLKTEDLLKDWCDHVYGAGAESVRAYLTEFAARWDGQKGHVSYFGSQPEGYAADLLDDDFVRRTRERLDAAREATMATLTPDSARAAYNVELERRLFEKWVRAFERGRAKQVSYAVPSAPTKVELRDAMWLHGRTWGKPHQPTEMEVWTTDEALRIRVACTEERMSEIYRGETGRDAPIFNAESVEFFVGVGDGVYRQMGVDAAGGTYEARGQDAKWNVDWDAKVSESATGWTADITLPYKSIALDGRKPKKGETWRLSVIRNNKGHEPVGFPGPVYRDLGLMAKLEF